MEEEKKEEIVLDLNELYQYKIQVLHQKLSIAHSNVITPLENAYKTNAAKALAESKEYNSARENLDACIKEVKEQFKPFTPVGWDLVSINPEAGKVVIAKKQ